ncbi:MAG: hypothetical protein AVDCRST_MAG88-4487, partial [uncultured Thermomicrobiales bacterium]
ARLSRLGERPTPGGGRGGPQAALRNRQLRPVGRDATV